MQLNSMSSRAFSTTDNKFFSKAKVNFDLLQPNILRREVQKALQFNTAYTREGNYFSKTVRLNSTNSNYIAKSRSKNPNKLNEIVQEFHKTYDSNMGLYRELREENDYFNKKYAQTRKVSERREMKNTKKIGSGPHVTFLELISNYKEKGYIIPDLSVEKNLFQPSSLLMENNKICNYYKLVEYMSKTSKNNKFKEKYDNDVFYLQNLTATINEKLTNDEEEKKLILKKMKTMKKRLSAIYLKTEDQLKEENNAIFKETEKIKNCMLEKQKKKNGKKVSKFLKKSSTICAPIRKYSLIEEERPYSPTEKKTEKLKMKSSFRKYNNTIEKKSNMNLLQNINNTNITNNNLNSTNGSAIFNINTSTTGFETFYDSATKRSNNLNYSKQSSNRNNLLMSEKNKTNTSLLKVDQKFEIKSSTQLGGDFKRKGVTSLYSKVPLNKKSIENSSNISRSRNDANSSKFSAAMKNKNFETQTSLKSQKDEKEVRIIDDEKIPQQEQIAKLEELYEKLNKKEYTNIDQEIKTYFSKFNRKEQRLLNENENTNPSDLLKYINDLKSKVSYTDVLDIYKNFTAKNGMLKLNVNEMKNVNDLDKRIKNLDYLLVKELRINKKKD